jgi:hypothetical protein
MDTYSPEFSALWEGEASPALSRDHAEGAPKEALSTSQERALEELADRVTAARSIV